MALSADEVGVYYNKGHAKEVEAKADHVNAACSLYLVNDTGGSLTSGDVVFLDSDGKVSTTATEGKDALILVVARNHDDTAQSIEAGASGWFQVVQRCPGVNVDASTAIGDWLVAAGTVKLGHPVTGTLAPQGAFAIALSACTGAGTVEALLLPTNLHKDDEHRATTAAVHGLGADVELVGSKAGTKRQEYKTITKDCNGDTPYEEAFTWPNAFTTLEGAVASIELPDGATDSPINVGVYLENVGVNGGSVHFQTDANHNGVKVHIEGWGT